MNRKNLTISILAGLAGTVGLVSTANAVNINHRGSGQVLIYPYFTVNGGNTTLMSVVNNSEYAKAVKIRFLEGKNSREVLDFNIYMSANDVWTASIKNIDGVPTLKTRDTTCTVPYIFGGSGSQPFLPWALSDEPDYDPNDISTLGDIARGTEGHFEVIEMGTVVEESESEGYITHVNGIPDDCAKLVEAWTWQDTLDPNTRGYWLKNPSVDMTDPSGGLFGGAAIVNVQKGTMYSYDAIAINGFADSIDANDFLHTEPGFTTPNLNSGDIETGYVFLGNGGNTNWTFNRGVDAVSYVLQQDSIANEYVTDDNVGAATEWVVTFPTKHFYVYPETSSSETVLAPFTNLWNGSDACEVILLDTIWDREEGIPGEDIPTGNPIPPIVSPAPPPVQGPVNPIVPFELCYETNVIAFGADGGGVLASNNLHTIDNDTEFFTSDHGWARLQLDEYDWDENADGIVDCNEDGLGTECNTRGSLGNLMGLPVAGFGVQSFVNAFLGDGANVLANYGGTFKHKTTVKLGSR